MQKSCGHRSHGHCPNRHKRPTKTSWSRGPLERKKEMLCLSSHAPWKPRVDQIGCVGWRCASPQCSIVEGNPAASQLNIMDQLLTPNANDAPKAQQV